MPVGISESDSARVLEIAWSLGAIQSEDELSDAAMAELLSFLHADQAGFNDVSLSDSQLIAKIYPMSPIGSQVRDALPTVIGEHPMVRALNQKPSLAPLRMSDVMPRRTFHRTATYELIFRPRGLEYQLNIPLRIDLANQTGVGYVVNRSRRDFTEEDVGRAVAIQSVLAALHSAAHARRPTPRQVAAARDRARITARELELLGLVKSGMTAAAIGRTLRISPRTVRKHLENVYIKIGVHDRLQAIEYCRQHQLLD